MESLPAGTMQLNFRIPPRLATVLFETVAALSHRGGHYIATTSVISSSPLFGASSPEHVWARSLLPRFKDSTYTGHGHTRR